MKKLVLLLLVFTSCEEYCEVLATKTDVNTIMRKESVTEFKNNVSLSRDMTIEGDVFFKNGLNLNGFTLTVSGSVKVKGYLNGGGTIKYCGTVKARHIQNNPILIEECPTLSTGDYSINQPKEILISCDIETPYMIEENGNTYLVELK
jgi:hypothetical protein